MCDQSSAANSLIVNVAGTVMLSVDAMATLPMMAHVAKPQSAVAISQSYRVSQCGEVLKSELLVNAVYKTTENGSRPAIWGVN